MMLSVGLETVELQAKLFRGFADASRLSILRALRAGPKTVGELVKETGLTQSNTSNHLACLRDCSLVRSKQEGRHVRYELSDSRIAKLLDTSENLLRLVAKELYDCTRYGEPARRRSRG